MKKPKKIMQLMAVVMLVCTLPLFVYAQTDLSKIPRIDVHAHVKTLENMVNYMKVREMIENEFSADLAIWINLSSPLGLRGEGIEYLQEAEKRFQGRFLTCLTNHDIAKGLKFSPEEVSEWMDRGVVGYKIWVGVTPAIDHPANDPTLTKMEQIGLPGASVHISQPYPTSWCESPVKFWEAQYAWKCVLDRHPDLIVVNAHMLDFFYSDEQLDHLMYMLETYPNLHVDLAARFKQFNRIDYEKLRKFIIQYADRILFGTDIGKVGEEDVRYIAERYHRCFLLLETDNEVEGGFFGKNTLKGLKLPYDILEKIYFKNAMRIYPRVKETLGKLGYVTE